MSGKYEYSTQGKSCPRCESMVGLYDYETAQPHDYCDCTVTPSNINISKNCQMVDFKITRREFCDGQRGRYICKYWLEVSIKCLNSGEEHSEEYEIEQTEEQYYDDISEAPMKAREKAQVLCQEKCELVG